MTKSIVKHLLYEIGAEEIPSEYLDDACKSIREQAAGLFENCGYQSKELEVFATPRRLVIFAKDFRKKEAVIEERIGPSKEQCYQNGSPTPALLGFLKSTGKKESDIQWKETPKGVRVSVSLKKETAPLRHLFEELPGRIEFPKLMRWEPSRFAFTRPIRWTFALIGTEFQKYSIGPVKSGNVTYGHRFLANRKIQVAKADINVYKKILRKNHVILDVNERVALVQSFLKKYFNHDEHLIRQVANLTEEPYPVKGTFKEEYLQLPAEVLSTCMRKHQKIFACYSRKGNLVNQFLAVINGKRSSLQMIAQNYENVLESRLEDAKFFYQEDTKTSLESKTEKLKDLIFLGSLGSYLNKTERLGCLSAYLLQAMTHNRQEIDEQKMKLAARLSKADLVSHLVYEFPELQGIAGREYACHDGLDSDICRSIDEHYFPKNLSESFEHLRKNLSPMGAMIGLVDRMDLLAGAMGIGIEPSGSQDPYALRRAGGGFVKLVRAFCFRFSVSNLINETAKLYGDRLKVSGEELQKKLLSFLKERLFFELNVKAGTKPYEILKAVSAVHSDDLMDVCNRFDQLNSVFLKHHEQFEKTRKVIERTHNILKGAKEPVRDDINASIFQEGLEKVLFDLIGANEQEFGRLLGEERYGELTRSYGDKFFGPVNDFFDQVMVNVENVDVRANRLALMKKINRMYTEKVADLSLVSSV